MLQQIRDIKGGNMNKKVYVANLPYQATEPELKALFLESRGCHVCQDCSGQAKRAAERYCLRGDVYAVGRAESCFHV